MENLQRLRLEKGLSINKLASIIEVSPTTVSHWEKGKRNPSLKNLMKLSKFFEVSLEYLFSDFLENKIDLEKIENSLANNSTVYNYIAKDYRVAIKELEEFISTIQQKSCKPK